MAEADRVVFVGFTKKVDFRDIKLLYQGASDIGPTGKVHIYRGVLLHKNLIDYFVVPVKNSTLFIGLLYYWKCGIHLLDLRNQKWENLVLSMSSPSLWFQDVLACGYLLFLGRLPLLPPTGPGIPPCSNRNWKTGWICERYPKDTSCESPLLPIWNHTLRLIQPGTAGEYIFIIGWL